MELKHRETQKQHRRRSRHSSIPALAESVPSDGLEPSATGDSSNGPSNNVHKMRPSKDAGDGLNIPSEASDLFHASSPDPEPTGKEKASSRKKHMAPRHGSQNN